MGSRFEIVDEEFIEELKDKSENENMRKSMEYTLKQPATGQSLVSYFLLTLLLILVRNLKLGKDPTKMIVRHPPKNV